MKMRGRPLIVIDLAGHACYTSREVTICDFSRQCDAAVGKGDDLKRPKCDLRYSRTAGNACF